MVAEFKLNLRRVLQVLILCLLSTQITEAQLLWKISKEGQADSFILGTHHLIPSDLVSEIKGVDEAYNSATAVVGEIDFNDLQSQGSTMAFAMLAPSDSLISNILTTEEYKQLISFNRDYPSEMLTDETINMFKPQALSMFISIAIGLKVNEILFPNNKSQLGIDMIFETRAVADKKNIYGLETMKQQLDLLLNSNSISDAAQELIELITCFTNDEEAAINEAKNIVKLYLEEDIDGLLDITENPKALTCTKMDKEDIKAMLDDRNIDWIPKLDQYMEKESCFIVVGALHLPGENGVLSLLKDKGYSITPISKHI